MRTVDGFIHRLLDGTKVVSVTKDGESMTIHAETGERWQIWFVDPNTGELIRGEPLIVGTQEFRRDDGQATDGHVNRAFSGQQIEGTRTDGEVLWFSLVGGRVYGVAWVNQAGQRVRAEPCLRKVDVVIGLPSVSIYGESGYGV